MRYNKLPQWGRCLFDIYSILNQFLGINSPVLVLTIYLMYYYFMGNFNNDCIGIDFIYYHQIY